MTSLDVLKASTTSYARSLPGVQGSAPERGEVAHVRSLAREDELADVTNDGAGVLANEGLEGDVSPALGVVVPEHGVDGASTVLARAGKFLQEMVQVDAFGVNLILGHRKGDLPRERVERYPSRLEA